LWLLLATRAWSWIEAWAERRARSRWVQGVLFFFAFFILTALAGLPLDMYGHHAERSYQISVQGWGSWFGDEAKGLGVTLVFGTLVLLLFNWIVRRWPRRYWFGVWLVTLPILVLLIFAAPLIAPLFDKFEPLSNNYPALVSDLEKVVARTGTHIPPDRMFLMKASLKTNGLNAYVSGIGATKRIVVWDTTAGRVPNDEILFIFAHETGHYVLRHIPKAIAGYAFALFFVYWGCSAFAAWLIRRFGLRWHAPDLASRTGFVVLLFTISVAGFLLEPAANGFSRHFEHQADVYGQEAIHGIVPNPQKTAVAASTTSAKPGSTIRIRARSSNSGFTTTPARRIAPTSPCITIRGRTAARASFSSNEKRSGEKRSGLIPDTFLQFGANAVSEAPGAHQCLGCPTLAAFLVLRPGWVGTNLNQKTQNYAVKALELVA
jgi:Zn-dependent protease with chaperone function